MKQQDFQGIDNKVFPHNEQNSLQDEDAEFVDKEEEATNDKSIENNKLPAHEKPEVLKALPEPAGDEPESRDKIIRVHLEKFLFHSICGDLI